MTKQQLLAAWEKYGNKAFFDQAIVECSVDMVSRVLQERRKDLEEFRVRYFASLVA